MRIVPKGETPCFAFCPGIIKDFDNKGSEPVYRCRAQAGFPIVDVTTIER